MYEQPLLGFIKLVAIVWTASSRIYNVGSYYMNSLF